MTVAETHPIKTNGLKKIYESYTQNVKDTICKKYLIFVTPLWGKLEMKQNYTIRTGEDATYLGICDTFEQYVTNYIFPQEQLSNSSANAGGEMMDCS